MGPKLKEVVIRCGTFEILEPYLDPNFNKIVILNAFDPFWGCVEIIDTIVRRIIDEPGAADKMVFLSADKNFIPDHFDKNVKFTAKPSFFLLHRGTIIDSVEGLDFPALVKKIDKSMALL